MVSCHFSRKPIHDHPSSQSTHCQETSVPCPALGHESTLTAAPGPWPSWGMSLKTWNYHAISMEYSLNIVKSTGVYQKRATAELDMRQKPCGSPLEKNKLSVDWSCRVPHGGIWLKICFPWSYMKETMSFQCSTGTTVSTGTAVPTTTQNDF